MKDWRDKPVVVIWSKKGKTERFPSKKTAAEKLGTSVSHVSRLIESGHVYQRGDDICWLDEGI